MSVGPLITEVILSFFITATVLHRYGNWYYHHIIVTLSVFIAWYFSMLIVFILPLDLSNTIYETCLKTHPSSNETFVVRDDYNTSQVNGTFEDSSFVEPCHKPWSYVSSGVFPVFWRIVYWSSQFLTWLILPIMQSYTKAGDFSIGGKLRSALIANAIYYGSYLLIVAVLLLYIALRPDIHLDGGKLRTIAATASNTWGLFWLVLLLGYGLVEVPRSVWHLSSIHQTLRHSYFKAAKLLHEKSESDDLLSDLLQSLKALSTIIGPTHPLREKMDIIESKVTTELLDCMRHATDEPQADVPSEKAMIRLHKQLLKAMQHHNRVEIQWELLIENIITLEDTYRNTASMDQKFRHSLPQNRHFIIAKLYTPSIEWYWRCKVRSILLKVIAIIFSVISAAVVWSELTFFVRDPTLSLFAVFVRLAQNSGNYIAIEMISSLTMAYIAVCTYSTLFKVRVLNLYYLAPHHQTDEYSLIFAGMMLCRLTPPMCLNFLSLIHMDSHIIDKQTEETHYTQIMGHMDVVPMISDGFNIYFPMMIVALGLATYYNIGSRLLSAIGFQQFIGDDELTVDLIEEGKIIVERELRRKHRREGSSQRQSESNSRPIQSGMGDTAQQMYRTARQRAESFMQQTTRRPSSDSAHFELLGDNQNVMNYSSRGLDSPGVVGQTREESVNLSSYGSRRPPIDKSLFDDV